MRVHACVHVCVYVVFGECVCMQAHMHKYSVYSVVLYPCFVLCVVCVNTNSNFWYITQK